MNQDNVYTYTFSRYNVEIHGNDRKTLDTHNSRILNRKQCEGGSQTYPAWNKRITRVESLNH